jgi:transcriptional regulator with XRE-family HTH domain
MMHKQSRQKEAINLYRKSFSQVEIAEILNVNQSTVSRYFNNPSRSEIEDFYENEAYGSYFTKDGKKIPFNRRYKPLEDKELWVDSIIKTEYYYTDGTYWPDRFSNSVKRKPVYESTKNWKGQT